MSTDPKSTILSEGSTGDQQREIVCVLRLSNRELQTVIAALRHFQRELVGEDKHPGDSAITSMEMDIATDGWSIDRLSVVEIDILCERISGGGEASPVVCAGTRAR